LSGALGAFGVRLGVNKSPMCLSCCFVTTGLGQGEPSALSLSLCVSEVEIYEALSPCSSCPKAKGVVLDSNKWSSILLLHAFVTTSLQIGTCYELANWYFLICYEYAIIAPINPIHYFSFLKG
jgi:hypothetical protein